jgi:hypothetical protein
MYHTAVVLDPQVKLTLIREQYGDGAPEIIKRIKDYLKREYQTATPNALAPGEVNLPRGVSAHQINLLRWARKSSSLALCDIDRFLDSEPLEWDENDRSNYELD